MGIYTNSFGETPEEQEKRRQHLYQVYDASVKKNEQQTAYKDTPQDQMTPVNSVSTNQNHQFIHENENLLLVPGNESLNLAINKANSKEFKEHLRQDEEDYNKKYSVPIKNGLQSFNSQDLRNIANTALLGLEKVLDGASLGVYGNLADNKLKWNYTQRNNQYIREAEQEGVGGIAKFNNEVLGLGASTVGPAKYLSKILPSKGINKATKILMDDAVGNGITEINHSGDIDDLEKKFGRGVINSPYIKLMQYFNK